jgi:hypothetical protein
VQPTGIELRTEPRVPVSFSGTLTTDGTSAPCLIQNMCTRGFLIKADAALPVGHCVHLRCELYPHQFIECKVQVRHVNRQCLGAKVIEIGDVERHLCLQFLEEQRSRMAA